MRAALAASVLIATAACAQIDPFRCATDDQCAPGRCEASGACSFVDATCHSGRRYGGDGDPSVAGMCVGAESGGIAQVAAGSEHTCARGDDGRVWCWGNDKYGGLGRAGDSAAVPMLVDAMSGVTDLDGGEFHTCALRSGQVWCWGADAQGELGRGNATDQAVPDPAPVEMLTGVTAIDLGEYHSCAIDTGGQVWCWGRNKDGEIGQNGSAFQQVPVVVAVPPARAIAAGGQETCAIAMTGDVWCWGLNASGQVGVPVAARVAPTVVPGFANATQIAVGGEHACAVFADGHAACTGQNDHGQLGNGTHDGSAVPVAVPGLTDAVEIAALDWSTCARHRDGAVTCWGEGDHGELAVGSADQSTQGAPLALSAPAVQLAGGESFACALTSDGCLWCWGLDTAGELGDGPGSPGGIRPVQLGACGAPAPAP